MTQETISVTLQLLLWPVLYFGVFAYLAQLNPSNTEQRLFRKGFGTDMVYWFLMPFFYTRLGHVILVGLFMLLYSDTVITGEMPQYGLGLFFAFPILLQACIALLIRDVLQYWVHRLFHKQMVLWKFHAVHHSTTEMDWLSSARTHPVDGTALLVGVSILVLFLGFSPEVFLLLAPFSTAYNALIHANLNWTFGPLRYVFVSPVFHRWHHTLPEEGGDKNFAPTFAFIDLLFGTYYMPKHAYPKTLGTSDPVPATFVGQILYPFKQAR